MTKGRLEAFSDGVLAIVITIMVLELKVPAHASSLADLRPLVGVFLSYVLSFVYIGIYWNNHHHLLYGVQRVSGGIMWANLHLLFWLSLIPFVTGWMGENDFAPVPTALYGVVMVGAAVAWLVLQGTILRRHEAESLVARALGRDVKGPVSGLLYCTAIWTALRWPWVSCAIYVLVALMWLVPDRRIERVLAETFASSSDRR